MWGEKAVKKNITALCFIFILLALAPSISIAQKVSIAPSYNKGNSLSNVTYQLIDKDETNTSIVYTRECFSECHLLIKVIYSGSIVAGSQSIDPKSKSNVDWSFIKKNTSDDIKITDIKVFVNNTWISTYTNNFQFQKGNSYYIDIMGKRSVSIGYKETDIVPTLFGFQMPELAIWSSNWSTYRQINFTIRGTDPIANYTVNVTFDTKTAISTGSMKSDCSDIRFVSSDNNTQFGYGFENATNTTSGCNQTFTQMWVAVNQQMTNGGYMYLFYNNSAATAVASMSNAQANQYQMIVPFGEGNNNGFAYSADGTRIYQVSGTAATSQGIYGSALSTQRTDKWFTNTQSTLNNLGDTNQNYTVYVWIKLNGSTMGTNPRVARHITNNGAKYPYWIYFEQISGSQIKLAAAIGDGSTQLSTGNGNDLSGSTTWMLATIVINGTSFSLYLNATLIQTITDSAAANNKSINALDIIGQLDNTTDAANNGFGGMIDHLTIIRRALTVAEINNTWQDGITGQQSSDISNPAIVTLTLNSPLNQTYQSVQPLNFVVTNQASLSNCQYRLDSISLESLITLTNCDNLTQLNASAGSHRLQVFVNASNITLVASVNFSYTLALLSIDSPLNRTYATVQNLNFTILNQTSFNNCRYELDGAANITLTSCNNLTQLNASSGSHVLTLFVNSSNITLVGNINFSYFRPTLVLNSPTNGTFFITQGLNFNVFNQSALTDCRYELDGAANISLSLCGNLSLLTSFSGSHSVQLFINDTNNGINVSLVAGVNFSYNFDNLNITAYDEITGNAINSFTIRLDNTTGTTTITTSTGNITFNGFTGTTYTLIVNSTNYGSRSYIYTRVNNQNRLSVFLPSIRSASEPHTVLIRLTTITGGSLPNIMITFQRNINGTTYNVTNQRTDTTGITSFILDGGLTYTLIIEFTSGTRIFSIQPAADSYTFSETGLSGTYSSIFTDIIWQTRPTTSILFRNISQTINLTILSNNASILSASITVLLNGVQYNITATVTGGGRQANAIFLADLSNVAGGTQLIANFYLNSSNSQIGYVLLETRTFTVWQAPAYNNLTLEYVLINSAQNSGMDITGRSILALLLTTIITGLVYSKLGGQQSITILVCFVCVLGVFAYAGWFDTYMFLITTILAGLAYFYYSGIQ